MTALTADRDTPEINRPRTRSLPVAADTKIYAGSLVVLSSGYAAPGTAAAGLVAVGRAAETVDNKGGAAGAASVTVERGVFRYANSAAGDAIAKADIGATVYIVDDQTVAKTSAANTRSTAGKVWDVDAAGVWVEIL
jgi:hypothetical protein